MTNGWDIGRVSAALQGIDGLSVAVGEPMAKHTSLGVGGPADLWVRADREDALALALQVFDRECCPWMPAGSGTNLLVTDDGIEGVVLTLAGEFDAVQLERFTGGPQVVAGASVTVARLLREVEAANTWGLEFLTGVPGTVGGALRMNAGTRHGYVDTALVEARIQSATVAEWRPAVTLGLSYRGCTLPAGELFVAARFAISDGRPDMAKRIADDLATTRRLRHPPMAGTAGSFFKNPDIAAGRFAGMLIENAGLKGCRHGGALVSPVHANFLSNGGTATATDLLELALHVRAEVERQAGVRMSPEVRIVGRSAAEWRARLGAD